MNRFLRFPGAGAALVLCACAGEQSALSPGSPQAERIVTLFWVLTAGSGAILTGVVVLAAIAIFGPERWRGALKEERFAVGAGIIFPIVTLSLLLAYGTWVLRAGAPTASGEEPLHIGITGEQWWWRVEYRDGEDVLFETANELRIPAGRPVEIALTTADVIHSFWLPRLAGKLDMIPGRTNVLTLEADAPGVSRGQCAEYCGGAHAMMGFYAVAMAETEFEAWLDKEASDARAPATPEEQYGQELFNSYGCGACHAVRGTAANGTIAPDLTHVGGRVSLAAGTMPNDEAAFMRWIAENQHIKPGNAMPPFGFIEEDELASIARYLASLR